MSLKQLAAFLSRDRNPVMKYLDQGMPAVEKADRDRGAAWVIDSSEAVRWLEERATKNVADRFGGAFAVISYHLLICVPFMASPPRWQRPCARQSRARQEGRPRRWSRLRRARRLPIGRRRRRLGFGKGDGLRLI